MRDGYKWFRKFYQVVFYGPSGTGKIYNAEKVLTKFFGGNLPVRGKHWNIVRFHVSHDYKNSYLMSKPRIRRTKYKTVNHVFGKMCETAANNPDKLYALIIDEINRVKVFPAIYTLPHCGHEIITPCVIDNNADIVIPENLHVICTLNTADCTVREINCMVRRPIAFVRCLPDRNVIKNEDALNLFDMVDGIFVKYLSKGFYADNVRIGHSYFLGEGNEFPSKVIYQVVPILQEYVKDGILLQSAAGIIEKIRKTAKNLVP